MIKRAIQFLGFCVLASLAFAYSANDGAKTISTDGSQADTQSAFDYVDAKNQDGWVITIGTVGGSYTWTSSVEFASTMVNDCVIISAGGIGNKTAIAMNFTYGGSGILLRGNDNKTAEIYGFSFTTPGGNTLGTGVIGVGGTGTAVAHNAIKIHDCSFDNCANYAVGVLWPDVNSVGAIYGVIYNCTLTANTAVNGMYFFAGNSSTNWSSGNMTWGTADTIVVEDCTFNMSVTTVEGRPAIDSSYNGARWMARHCTFTHWVCVAHGADSAPTSTLQVEMLHNTFNLTINDAVDYIMYLRGGSMRFWDNTVNLSGGASLNQIIKTANDSALPGTPIAAGEHFQQVGHGVVSGVEAFVMVRVWGNTINGGSPTLFGLPVTNNNLVSGTHYLLTDPGDYTELAYPHPLRGAVSAALKNPFRSRLSPAGAGF